MVEIERIQTNMPVLDLRGNRIGTVDSVQNMNEIKLARANSPDGLHHYIPLNWVDVVDGSVRLNRISAEVLVNRD